MIDELAKKVIVAATKAFEGSLNLARHVWAGPAKLEALEKRVAELEEKLGSKRPPDVCQACGERQVRLSWSAPGSTKTLIYQAWSCKACGFVETRYVHPIGA
jgi:hypothetical protein